MQASCFSDFKSDTYRSADCGPASQPPRILRAHSTRGGQAASRPQVLSLELPEPLPCARHREADAPRSLLGPTRGEAGNEQKWVLVVTGWDITLGDRSRRAEDARWMVPFVENIWTWQDGSSPGAGGGERAVGAENALELEKIECLGKL